MFKHSILSGFSFFDNELSGQAIVFVHGLGAHAQYADFLVKAFPSTRLILAEMPGHGMAPAPGKTIDIALLANELILALQQSGIDKPILCGHSLGGQICLLAEIVQPGFARKMILLSPAGLESFSETEIHIILTSLNLSSLLHSYKAPHYSSSFLKLKPHFPESKIIQNYVASMLHRPVRDLLYMIKCEVQIYFGENDMLIPNRLFRMESTEAYVERILKELPNFSLNMLSNAGHWPMLENANELIKMLKQNNPDLK